MNLVFYDLETTGTSTAYDQPLQFAAIVTDANFNELERIEFRCRLSPHILPSVYALAITGMTPEQCLDPTLPSFFEFTQSISKLTERWAPAIWIGYNTIKFDEEMLRQAFYQNLQPDVYATQLNGNSRFDVMHAVHAYYVKKPNLLKWPMTESGKPIFKLDRLAPENGFIAHNAHDALGDVEATIHLSKLLSNGDKELWRELFENHDKKAVQSKLENLQPMDIIMRFGGTPPKAYRGCFCGFSKETKTEACFFDFEVQSPLDFINSSDEELKNAVTKSPKIIRAIATNKAPALLKVLDPTNEELLMAAAIAGSPEFRERAGIAMAERYGDGDPHKPVEKQIYGKFYSSEDRALLERFQVAHWHERLKIIDDFSDMRLKQLGRRLIAFNCPELLTQRQLEQFHSYLNEKWHSSAYTKDSWMTLDQALLDIESLFEEGKISPVEKTSLEDFYKKRTDVHPT